MQPAGGSVSLKSITAQNERPNSVNSHQLCASIYGKLALLPGTQLSLSSTPPVPAAANGFILKLSPCLLTLLSH